MDDAQIRALRLAHQGLVGSDFTSPAAVVAAFGAMQAQEFAMACWAIGLRAPGTDENAVIAAFNAGQIVRTHVLRPTWHFVAAADLRWLLALSAPRVHALNAYQHRQLGLKPAQLRRGADVIARVLADGQPLTRDELQVHLTRAGLKYAGPALAYVMMYAELEGLICSGPRRGRKFTYALLEKRVAPSTRISREDGLVRLARKFFATRGPATAQDFSTWSSFPQHEVADAIAALGADFAHDNTGRRPVYFPVGRAPIGGRSRVTALLPDYDEYGISYRDRSALFADTSSTVGKLAHNRAVLVDGTVVGSWRRTLTGDGVRFEFQFITPPSPAQRKAIDAAVARYCCFIGHDRAK